jgi:hypothetical protein
MAIRGTYHISAGLSLFFKMSDSSPEGCLTVHLFLDKIGHDMDDIVV